MVRLTYPRSAWAAIAQHLLAADTPPPPGLRERIDALLAAAPAGWPDQPCALELDEAAAAAVGAAASRLRGGPADAAAGQRAASLAEAEAIVRDHQRRR